MDEATLVRRGRVRLAILTAGVLIVGLAGYLGFVWFVETERTAGSGILMLGALTGFAAFFSPCSFPLLLTFLARRADESRRSAFDSALGVGLGATLMLGLLGALVVVGGVAIGGIVQFDQPLGRAFRTAIGLILVLLGLRQSRVLDVSMDWLDSVARKAGQSFDLSKTRSKTGRDVVYGLGYLLVGFG